MESFVSLHTPSAPSSSPPTTAEGARPWYQLRRPHHHNPKKAANHFDLVRLRTGHIVEKTDGGGSVQGEHNKCSISVRLADSLHPATSIPFRCREKRSQRAPVRGA